MRCNEVVKKWLNIANGTIVVFDSYYLDTEGRKFATTEKKPFIAAVQPTRFPLITAHLKDLPLNKENWNECWVAAFNETSGELLVKCKDPDQQTETKYCLTNAFKRTQHRKNQTRLKSIPGYSVYGQSFNVCDRFNRALNHRKWPHKCGGNGKEGELGQHHSFALAVAAENIFNLYHCVNKIDHLSTSFEDFFVKLADDIAIYASTLPKDGKYF